MADFSPFTGYRLWFNGNLKWHSHDPQRASHFVHVVMEWYRVQKTLLKQNIGPRFTAALVDGGVRDLQLDVVVGLLPVLSAHQQSPETSKRLMRQIEFCQPAFRFLPRSFLLDLMEIWLKWLGQVDEEKEKKEKRSWSELESTCSSLIETIMDMILPVDEAFRAKRYWNIMYLAKRHGKPHEFEAKKQKLMDLLKSG